MSVEALKDFGKKVLEDQELKKKAKQVGMDNMEGIIALAKEKGIINEMKEAFSTEYIGRAGKAYVERYNLTPPEAINLIKQAGGIPVLAHPGYLSDRTSLHEEIIEKYSVYDLQGIEVYYSCHNLNQVNYYLDIAQKYNLLITGGSDSHGNTEPMLGSIKLPYKYAKALKKAYFQKSKDTICPFCTRNSSV